MNFAHEFAEFIWAIHVWILREKLNHMAKQNVVVSF